MMSSRWIISTTDPGYHYPINSNQTGTDLADAEAPDGVESGAQVKFLFPNWDYSVTPDWHYLVVGSILLLLGIIGSLGNIAVIFVFLRSKHWRGKGNYLLVNLALSDLLASIGTFPFLVVYNYSRMYMSQMTVCYLYSITAGLAGFSSIGSMAAIALDRLIGLTKSHTTPNVTLRQHRTLMMIVVVWLYALSWCLLPLFGVGRYAMDGIGTSCTFDYMHMDTKNMIFVAGLFCGGFGLPFCLMLISYGYIYMIIRRHQEFMISQEERIGVISQRANRNHSFRQDIKLARVGFVIVSLFTASWLPYSVVAITGMTQYRRYLNPYVSLIPGLFAKASAIYNPFIYCATSKHFRCCLKKLVLSCKCRHAVPYWAEPRRHDLYIHQHNQNIPLQHHQIEVQRRYRPNNASPKNSDVFASLRRV